MAQDALSTFKEALERCEKGKEEINHDAKD